MTLTTTMRFRNYGGIYQFAVTDENDLALIDTLDPARWAATSAPLPDLHTDAAFLAALDPEATGRIRVSQIVAARNWLFERLANKRAVRGKSDVLVLADIDRTSEAGAKLAHAAEDVIKQLKLADDSRLSLADVRAFRAGYQKTLANGDGVVPPEVVLDAEVAQLIKDIIATTGGAKDASGSDGVGQAELDKFLTGGAAWLDWHGKGPAAMHWGVETAAAGGLVTGLDAKIEAYFTHCDLLAQEQKTAQELLLKEDDLRLLSAKDVVAIDRFLADSPLAVPVPTGSLSLGALINPVYRERFEALRAQVLVRALGATTKELTRSSWRTVKAGFDAWNGWQNDKPKENFEALGEDRVRAIIGGLLPHRIVELTLIDLAALPHIEQVADVEKLIMLQHWLIELVNNFVNFSAIYRRDQTALIEMGSLVLDGRRLDFCIKVNEHGGHKKIASESLCYLIYANITSKDGSAPVYEVMAPVTGGERGRFRVGKRGIFIDLDGKEWDSQISDIVENPISVIEAMFAPFRKVSQFINKKIEDWAGSAQAAQEKEMMAGADKGVTEAQKASEAAARDAAAGKAPPPGAKPEPKGLDVNALILGGGIALAGVSSVLAVVFGLFTTLKGWLAILGVVGVVMALSALVGWLKLRKRDMGLILEASGWALNISMKVNRRISRVFTYTPALPPGSKKDRVDMLATKEDSGPGKTILAIVLVLLAGATAYWYFEMGHPLPAFLSSGPAPT